MAVERVDYYSEDDYQLALRAEAEQEAQWRAEQEEMERLAFEQEPK
jgi:hypothetical protein